MDKDRISHSFAAAAAGYDTHAVVQRHAAQRLAQLITQRWPDVHSVCEIGCGTGNLTAHLSEAYPQADILATDLAPAMLAACEQRLGSRARYAQADGEHIDARGFDLVASSLAFQWFNEQAQAIERLTKQSQRLAVATLLDGTFVEWKAAHARLGQDDGVLSFMTEDALRALCKRLGAQYQVETAQESYPDAIAFVRAIKAIGAGTPRSGHKPASLGKVLRQFPDGITISYRVAYILAPAL